MKGTDSSPVVSYSLVNIKAWSRGARRVMGRVSRSRHSRSVPRVRISYSNSSWFKWRRLGTSEGQLQQLSWETFGDYCSFGGFQYFPREILSVEPIYFKGASLYHYPIVRFTETCLTFSSQVHLYPPWAIHLTQTFWREFPKFYDWNVSSDQSCFIPLYRPSQLHRSNRSIHSCFASKIIGKFGTANWNCQIERQTSEKTGLTDTFSVDPIDPLTISV